MERSEYWNVYRRYLPQNSQGRNQRTSHVKPDTVSGPTPAHHSGQFPSLDIYLRIPTFQRLGLRLGI